MEEWKGHMEDAPENRAGDALLEGKKCQKKFPSAHHLPKGVSGDSLWHTGTRDVERGKKEERCWTEAYPEKGEEKCFPKCLIVPLSIFSQCLNQ